jgi:membrane protease YdiL (CAAX protease family)
MQAPKKQSFIDRIQLRDSQPDWSFTTAMFFVLAYPILWIIGQIIISTLSGNMTPTPNTLSLGALFGSLISIFVVVQWARRRFGATWIDTLRLRAPIKPPVFLVVLVGLGLAWATDLLGLLLRLKADQFVPPVLAVLQTPIGLSWAATAVLAVIVQPIAEGLIFAGILYPALAHDLKNNLLAALATAAVYTVVSMAVLSTGSGTWFALIQPFVMALVVILARAYTRSTQSAIVVRALFGLFFVLAALITLRPS